MMDGVLVQGVHCELIRKGLSIVPDSGAGGGGSEGWALFSGNKVQNLEAGAPYSMCSLIYKIKNRGVGHESGKCCRIMRWYCVWGQLVQRHQEADRGVFKVGR
jgi:hypothetical protein